MKQFHEEELQEIKPNVDVNLEKGFETCHERFKILSEKAVYYKNQGNNSQFQQYLLEDIDQQINTLQKYQNKFKIYIVFMGTISSGKSTFINSLLGQQLLPSKNQSCTSQVTFIGHSYPNANQDTKITINGEDFEQLQQASQQLIELQQKQMYYKQKMSAMYIKTQSYFHTTLNKHLQERVEFIDTPGIELSKVSPKQYMQHFGEINQFIKLDEYSIRINLWILNYTTFSSDKELQKNMNFMTKKDEEQIQKQDKRNQQKRNLLQRPSSEFFYILNKYERQQEDDTKEQVLQEVQESFDSNNVFLISASNALQYNVMTFGSIDAQNKLILALIKNKELPIKKLSTFDKAKEFYINYHINDELLEDQDFNEFTKQISLEIEKQLIKLFESKLNQLEQLMALLVQSKQLVNEKELRLQLIKDKMNKLNSYSEKHEEIKRFSQIKKEVEKNIQQTIDITDKCQNNSKIYIVFMGTLSSGKKTFINSLIGQQLLPSKKQSCITYIGHQINNISKQSEKININQEEFKSLEMASQKLIQISENSETMGTVNIKTQSHFHSTFLRKDLQERVFFIDTPGIELSKTTPEQYQEHFAQINQLIQLDEYSIRINLWILDFDSEVNELKQIISRVKNVIENQQQQEPWDQNSIQQIRQEPQDKISIQIRQSVPYFYIINKVDISKITENKLKLKALEDIKNQLNVGNIFMISAQDALCYNVMNYGTQDAQQKFLQDFFNDNEEEFNSIDDADKHCKNPYLIELQNLNEFTTQLSGQIEQQLLEVFEHRLEGLNKEVYKIDYKTQSMESIIILNDQLQIELTQFSSIIEKTFNEYKQELETKQISFSPSITLLIDKVKQQIKQKDNQPAVEKTCYEVLCQIDELNLYFHELIQKFNYYLGSLQGLEDYPEQRTIIIGKCVEIIKVIMENTIPEQQRQFLEEQVRYVYEDMGICSYSSGWFEIVWKSVKNFFWSKAKSAEFKEGSVALCAFVAHHSQVTDKPIDLTVLQTKLNDWNQILQQKIQQQVNLYLKNFTMAKEGIEEFMRNLQI